MSDKEFPWVVREMFLLGVECENRWLPERKHTLFEDGFGVWLA
jgi:hypothetical protein